MRTARRSVPFVVLLSALLLGACGTPAATGQPQPTSPPKPSAAPAETTAPAESAGMLPSVDPAQV